MKIYSRYKPPEVNGVCCLELSLTQQDFIGECDINNIMARFLKTGTVPSRSDMGKYGDFSGVGDFREAQDILLKSNEQFAALSSKVRERFKNDPGLFLDWVHSDKCSLEEAHEFGILSQEGIAKVEERKRVAAAPTGEPKAS